VKVSETYMPTCRPVTEFTVMVEPVADETVAVVTVAALSPLPERETVAPVSKPVPEMVTVWFEEPEAGTKRPVLGATAVMLTAAVAAFTV